MTDALVSTGWVAERLGSPDVRVIEVSSAGLEEYARGHIEGALAIDWKRELIEHEDESSGMVIAPERFRELARRLGLVPADALVFYGDKGGRHACRALWTFAYYRHPGPLHVMDGGREAWQREGRPTTANLPVVSPSDYPQPPAPDESIRATREEIVARLEEDGFAVLDARTEGEHAGTDVRAKRGGRIPGARHVFWQDAVAEDGRFRAKEELAKLYERFSPESTVAAHCQLGIRSAHTWFVLRHILGYPDVKNYDGSWREGGDRDDTPIDPSTGSG